MFKFQQHLHGGIMLGVFLLNITAGCKNKEPLAVPITASATMPPQGVVQVAIKGATKREANISAAIERAIVAPASAGYTPIPTGTKLFGVEIIGSKIRLNFTKALLLNGTGRKLEDAVKQLTNPVSDITSDMVNVEYEILIEGKPIREYL